MSINRIHPFALTLIAVTPLVTFSIAMATSAPGFHDPVAGKGPLFLPGLLLCVGWGLVFSYLNIRRQDEFNMAGIKTTWFWAAQIGSIIAVLFTLNTSVLHPVFDTGTTQGAAGFRDGVTFVILTQLACAALFGLIWKVRKS